VVAQSSQKNEAVVLEQDKSIDTVSADQNVDQNADETVGQLTPDTTTGTVTTIIKSDDIVPGSVVISDKLLDDSELFAQPSVAITQAPERVFTYDSRSELGQALDASADLTGRIAAFRALAAACRLS